jgi:hypothetical protein
MEVFRMIGFLGPTGTRLRRALPAAVLFAMLTSLVVTLPALAVHDTGAFQLDGNAQQSVPALATGDDWDNVCHQYSGAVDPTALCSTTINTTGSTAGLWTCDKSLNATTSCTNNATIFTSGGSKDPQDINNWVWKDGAGGLPDKDNLVHAFAARYSLTPSTTCPSSSSTCEVIFFGIDRFDNSGDAQNGVWFLQNQVGLGTNSVGGGSGFTGVHKLNDILVISDFSNGGGTATITVYTWDPACTATNKPFSYCGDANLHTRATSAAAKCDPSLAGGDSFCGIVNPTDGTPVPWNGDYTDKSGNHTYLNGEFYEAGINLSSFGLGGECFSSMVSESRSSTSTTATLKDFVLGNFAQCKPSLTTQASTNGSVLPGQAVRDTATITVKGGTTPDDATGTMDFYLCGPNSTGNPDCSTDGTSAGTGKPLTDTTSNPKDGISGAISDDVNTSTSKLAPGYYCFAAVAHLTNYDSPGRFTDTGNGHECFRVTETTTAISEQYWFPNDKATVSSDHGALMNGTLSIQLYDGSATCASGHEVTGQVYSTPVVNAASATVDSNSQTTFKVKVTDDVSWLVTFTSTDTNVGSSSHCEFSNLTITN